VVALALREHRVHAQIPSLDYQFQRFVTQSLEVARGTLYLRLGPTIADRHHERAPEPSLFQKPRRVHLEQAVSLSVIASRVLIFAGFDDRERPDVARPYASDAVIVLQLWITPVRPPPQPFCACALPYPADKAHSHSM
jgi:hypothetical protein